MQSAHSEGLVFKAIPSDENALVKLNDKGLPIAVFPGQLSLTQSMADWIGAAATTFWHEPGRALEFDRPKWIINTLSDPDPYPDALRVLDVYAKGHGVPVFNAPKRVLDTRRDVSAALLEGIPNLIVPKCKRFRATALSDFNKVFAAHGFEFPVLVRPEGSQTGRDMLLIKDAGQWSKIHLINWADRDMYMTQFVPFENADGRYCKMRVVITPDRVSILHLYFVDHWFINNRVVFPQKREETLQSKELALLQGSDNWQVVQNIGAAIRERVGLDYFGADIGFRSENEFVLFEANAAMSIMGRNYVPVYRRDEHNIVYDTIEADIWRALSQFTGLPLPR